MRYTYKDFKVIKEDDGLYAVGMFGENIYAVRYKEIESIWIPNTPYFYKFYEITKEVFDAFPENIKEVRDLVYDRSYSTKNFLCASFYEDVNHPNCYFDRVDKNSFEYYLHLYKKDT